MKRTVVLLVTAVVLACPLRAHAQLSLQWYRLFAWNHIALDAAQAAAWDAAGDLYVAGYHYPSTGVYLTVVKYNSAGVYQWNRTYYEMPYGVAGVYTYFTTDSHDNVVVAAPDGYAMTTRKFSPAGALLWRRTTIGPHDYAQPVALTVDGADNVFVCGSTVISGAYGAPHNNNVLTIKYSPSGVQQWSTLYGGPAANAEPAGMAVDAGGNVYDLVTVSTSRHADRVVVYNHAGVRQTVAYLNIGSSSQFFHGQALALTGSRVTVLLLNQNAPVASAIGSFAVVAGTDIRPLSLVLRWVRKSSNYLTSLAPAGDGSVAACGTDETTTRGRAVEWDSAGNQTWSHTFTVPGGTNSFLGAVAGESSGGIIVAGNSTVKTAQGSNIVETNVLEYSPTGARSFTYTYAPGVQQVPQYAALSADGSHVAVGGQVLFSGPSFDSQMFTLNFAVP